MTAIATRVAELLAEMNRLAEEAERDDTDGQVYAKSARDESDRAENEIVAFGDAAIPALLAESAAGTPLVDGVLGRFPGRVDVADALEARVRGRNGTAPFYALEKVAPARIEPLAREGVLDHLGDALAYWIVRNNPEGAIDMLVRLAVAGCDRAVEAVAERAPERVDEAVAGLVVRGVNGIDWKVADALRAAGGVLGARALVACLDGATWYKRKDALTVLWFMRERLGSAMPADIVEAVVDGERRLVDDTVDPSWFGPERTYRPRSPELAGYVPPPWPPPPPRPPWPSGPLEPWSPPPVEPWTGPPSEPRERLTEAEWYAREDAAQEARFEEARLRFKPLDLTPVVEPRAAPAHSIRVRVKSVDCWESDQRPTPPFAAAWQDWDLGETGHQVALVKTIADGIYWELRAEAETLEGVEILRALFRGAGNARPESLDAATQRRQLFWEPALESWRQGDDVWFHLDPTPRPKP